MLPECCQNGAMTPGRSFQLLLDRLTRFGTVLVACTSAVAVCGWLFNDPVRISLLPGLASMKFNTALGLLFAAIAIWLLHTRASSALWRGVARVLAGILLLLGILTLLQDLLALDFGIDQWILPDSGRMSPASSFSCVFIGGALLALKARHPAIAACAHWLIVPPLFVATLAMMGYAYDVSALFQVKAYTTMAVYTAASFFVVGLCVLAADTGYGFASISIGDTAGGVVSRRLLPTLPMMIFLLGWAVVAGQAHGLYDTHFSLALMALFNTTVCVIAVASTAITLHKVDLTRQRGEAEILSLNACLLYTSPSPRDRQKSRM